MDPDQLADLCLHSFLKRVYNFAFRSNTVNEPQDDISNNVVCATSKGSDQPVHMCSLIRAFASHLDIL